MRTLVLIALLAVAAPSRGAGPPAGLPWETDWDNAFALAREQNKLVFVDFFATWCGPCRMMDESVFPQAAMQKQLAKFVLLRVDFDRSRKGREKRIAMIPTYIVYDRSERERFRITGVVGVHDMAGALEAIAAETTALVRSAELYEQQNAGEAAMTAGHAYLRLRQGREAREAYGEARRAAAANKDAFAVRMAQIHEAFTWSFDKKAAKTIKELRGLLANPANDESDVVAWYFLGRAAEERKDVKLARDAYVQAQSLASADSTAGRSAGERLRRLGN